ncbi:GNAT family N-acetyltransferase [Actinocatenispora comari]|jgi:GNAT superfamily N-acetyltransferase|uniref:N-acetyltransferase domain-containing protein n=1 Tax=Actinocatenispora comari TaxID=2807577 RepID=A0A8J4ACF4_9ACTN|nr:GNAT family N-acetyltransferase [Actinocatenispora comari]GIL29051.1 hypothetical protein NUM_43050 [Actinocatenispora comari]
MTAVRNATTADRDTITHLIDRAFFHLDANTWLVPETPQRSDVMRRYLGLHVEHAVEHGTAVQVALDDQDQAIVGAALWYPAGDPGPADYDTRLAGAVGPERLHRFQRFEHLLHEHTPDTRHDYLGFLAVDPDHQGAGVGGRLLREWHWHLDAAGRPAYLVASNKRSARLYWTHGYRPLDGGRDELLLPGGGSMYRMWRVPGAGDSSITDLAGAAGDPA